MQPKTSLGPEFEKRLFPDALDPSGSISPPPRVLLFFPILRTPISTQLDPMASALMNAIKEEVLVSTTTVASVTSTAASATRSTVSHTLAASAPSASVRAAVGHSGAETAALLAGAGRQELAFAARTQPVLGNLSAAATESPILSSVLGRAAESDSNAIKNILPELREQVSQAAQQGFEEVIGDQAPRLEPSWGIAETAKQIEEVVAAR